MVKVGGSYVYLTEDGRHAFVLGIELRVNGTPAIVLPDGCHQPGYLPANRLLSALGLGRKKQRL